MLSRLPVQEPQVFRGDPLAYPEWKSAFSLLIERKNITPREKLLYLKKYLAGEAKNAVGSFFLMSSEDAFVKALDQLENRYGNSYIVSQAFRSKLESWPAIKNKDATAFRSYADFLSQCLVAAAEIGNLGILDDPHHVKSLVQKLPEWARLRWNRQVAYTKSVNKRYPTYKELVSFVKNEADVMNDPVFGENASSSPLRGGIPEETKGRRGGGSDDKGRTNASSGTETTPLCTYCKKPKHKITECRTFTKLTPKEKKDFVLGQKLCFGCLASTDHIHKQCKQKATCSTCKEAHPTCLHRDKPNPKDSQLNSKSSNTVDQTQTVPVSASNSKTTVRAGSVMTTMVVPVMVSSEHNPNHEFMAYALLDTQSDATFVTQELIDELHPKTTDTVLELTTLSGTQRMSCLKAGGLRVRALDSENSVSLPDCFSREVLEVDRTHFPSRETAKRHAHLHHLEGELQPPMPEVPVGLLIGFDCSEALIPLDIVQGEPYAVRTRLGWSIVGCSSEEAVFDTLGSSLHTATKETEKQAEKVVHVYRTAIKEVCPSDVIRVLERDFERTEYNKMSQEDHRFIDILSHNIKRNQTGHYEMPLPFKSDTTDLPDNREVALKRVFGLKRQFQRRPEYHKDYMDFMNDIVSRGDAEKVPSTQITKSPRWYVPHHGVYHPHKPGKIRVVFDCSARHQGTSLNEQLLQGPDLLNSLIGVLCRFRMGLVAFSCDVEKMFHQFHVAQQHQDFLRFLWWEEGDTSKPPVDYRMKVHLFGAVSSPGCANFGLRQVAQDQEDLSPEGSNFLQRDFYVDDGLHSKDTVQSAVSTLKGAIEICAKGGLRLHKIVSNSSKLLSSFPASEIAMTAEMNFPSVYPSTESEGTLGLRWYTDTDSLGYREDIPTGRSTRRGILSTVASLYDPLGFLSPFILKGRLVLQEMCRDNLSWDDPLPDKLSALWEAWKLALRNVGEIRIPRCFTSSTLGELSRVELHHFSDASTFGYGQCSYLRLVDSKGIIKCSLALAKSRVAPLKTVTVPRLELQAAVLSIKTAAFLQRELSYETISHHFWTDSQIVLAYIANESTRFHVFVANRVRQIRDFSTPEQWSYVPTTENPADHASRGLDVESITSSNWLSGPSFLHQSDLPQPTPSFSIPEDDKEVKRCALASSADMPFESFEKKLCRFSSRSKLLLGIAALVKRRERAGGRSVSDVAAKQMAEMYVVKCVQHDHFTHPAPNTTNHLKQLQVYRDDNLVLRVGGRAKQSTEPMEVSHPVILPRDSQYSLLVVRECHEKIQHQGMMFTMHRVRDEGYWVIGLRGKASRVVRQCAKCIRKRGIPQAQRMADLPAERLEPSPPFTYCGVDCFGPFPVKDGRKEAKRYGLIVTCLASRAVHIEMLVDMSTDAFMMALRNVIALRGDIRLIRCDQGTNFVGASRELKRALNEMDPGSISYKLLELNCEFKFNPPAASHRGGVWERQIRTIRSVLSSMLSSTRPLSSDALRTFLYEAAAIVNSRPLSVESLEDSNSPVPLSPNSILTQKHSAILPPPGVFVEADLYVRQRWRAVQLHANEFWRRWRRSYLASLQSRRRWQDEKENLKQGDVVILTDEQVERSLWRLAKVIEAIPDQDGLVRTVRLLVAPAKDSASAATPTELVRPVQKLILLVSV